MRFVPIACFLFFSWENKTPLPLSSIKQIFNRTGGKDEPQVFADSPLGRFMWTFISSCFSLYNNGLDSDMQEVPDASTTMDWILSRLDPLGIPSETYPVPTQEDICSTVLKMRCRESLVFSFRCQWYSLVEIYEKHPKSCSEDQVGVLDTNNETQQQSDQYVWKSQSDVEVSDELKGKIETAIRRNPQSSVVLMGVKVHYVSVKNRPSWEWMQPCKIWCGNGTYTFGPTLRDGEWEVLTVVEG